VAAVTVRVSGLIETGSGLKGLHDAGNASAAVVDAVIVAFISASDGVGQRGTV
jgi:hypothetical protein